MIEKQNITSKDVLQVLTGEYSLDQLQAKFDEIANFLMNASVLKVNNVTYRITELEMYYNDNSSHVDPYIHMHKNQLQSAEWYFHGSGLDITFGNDNKENNIYASLLIRGIKNLESGKYIDGPLNVVTELFSKMGKVYKENQVFHLLPYTYEDKEIPAKSTRVGLNKKEEDEDNYIDRLYRYIIEINSKHRFTEKTKVAQQMLKTSSMGSEKINKLFGYKIV